MTTGTERHVWAKGKKLVEQGRVEVEPYADRYHVTVEGSSGNIYQVPVDMDTNTARCLKCPAKEHNPDKSCSHEKAAEYAVFKMSSEDDIRD